ncbi:DUF6401 family natural product biosynthesis protein [Micromonospora sp. LZ34]
MPRIASLLLLSSLLLFFAAGYATVAAPRLSGSRAVTALLLAQNATATALAAVAVGTRSWWDLVTALILGVASVVPWELHLATRAGRPSRVLWRQISRTLAQRRGGRRLWTLTELRAEYAQTILDDAEQDPNLAAILDDLADRVVDHVKGADDGPRLGLAETLTAYANGYLDSLSDPGRQPLRPGYRGYSTDMLMIAAVCLAADRLGTR